jgi:hypothetical protein
MPTTIEDIVTAYNAWREAEAKYWAEWKDTWKIAGHPNHAKLAKTRDAFYKAVSNSPYDEIFTGYGYEFCGSND